MVSRLLPKEIMCSVHVLVLRKFVSVRVLLQYKRVEEKRINLRLSRNGETRESPSLFFPVPVQQI